MFQTSTKSQHSNNIFNLKKSALLFIAAFLTMTAFIGCKDDPVAPAPDPTPSFTISSYEFTSEGTDFIQFYFRSDMDIVMTKVLITNPMNASATYNLDNSLFITDELVGCQESTEAYYKYGGQYTFAFVGKTNNTNNNFDINTSFTVTKK